MSSVRSNWIVPGIISVNDIVDLPDDVLYLFTRISTGIITKRVNEFVDNNINSDNQNNRQAASKLKIAYEKLNRTNEYLSSQDAKDLADALVNLQYSDVSVNTDIHMLKKYRQQILELLTEDEDFLRTYTGEVSGSETRGMKTAYTAKLDKSNLEDVLEEMRELALEHKEHISTILNVVGNIEKNKSLFKNGNYNVNNHTVLRKAIYKKDKLRNILKGLDFLIPRVEASANARGWRRL